MKVARGAGDHRRGSALRGGGFFEALNMCALHPRRAAVCSACTLRPP